MGTRSSGSDASRAAATGGANGRSRETRGELCTAAGRDCPAATEGRATGRWDGVAATATAGTSPGAAAKLGTGTGGNACGFGCWAERGEGRVFGGAAAGACDADDDGWLEAKKSVVAE